ncbi:MAG TPA: hypothetical protein V6C96_02950, partial [Vampirovibrionales bacterium]
NLDKDFSGTVLTGPDKDVIKYLSLGSKDSFIDGGSGVDTLDLEALKEEDLKQLKEYTVVLRPLGRDGQIRFSLETPDGERIDFEAIEMVKIAGKTFNLKKEKGLNAFIDFLKDKVEAIVHEEDIHHNYSNYNSWNPSYRDKRHRHAYNRGSIFNPQSSMNAFQHYPSNNAEGYHNGAYNASNTGNPYGFYNSRNARSNYNHPIGNNPIHFPNTSQMTGEQAYWFDYGQRIGEMNSQLRGYGGLTHTQNAYHQKRGCHDDYPVYQHQTNTSYNYSEPQGRRFYIVNNEDKDVCTDHNHKEQHNTKQPVHYETAYSTYPSWNLNNNINIVQSSNMNLV